ncbi:DUF58 domain-containing protein [Rhodovibrionaceae bacterium A322]
MTSSNVFAVITGKPAMAGPYKDQADGRPPPAGRTKRSAILGRGAHAQNLQLDAEELAGNFPPLLLAAERVASSIIQGVHGRRRVGQGESFWQFRVYEPGDHPQRIDWRQTAKSDRTFVREMEWEAAQAVYLWRDNSASMNWTSDPGLPSKRAFADHLLLALSVLLTRAGERITLLDSGQPPRNDKHALANMALQLAVDSGEEPRSSSKPSQKIWSSHVALPPQTALPRYAQTVWFSDFLSPLEEIEGRLRDYAKQGLNGLLVQILDPAEASLPYRGRIRFEDLRGETGWLLSRTERVRESYLQRLALQQEGLETLARKIGWTLVTFRSDHAPKAALLSLYSALNHQALAPAGPVSSGAASATGTPRSGEVS